jgi:uncharacterized membrane protein SpoIIM required for sporulation
MDYARFVELRGPLWQEFEEDLASARQGFGIRRYEGLERLALQHRQILHDHALASSRFPGTGAARRLERLALEGTHWLQWDRGDRIVGLGAFFGRIFPDAFRRALPRLGIVTLLFAASALLGFSLGAAQPAVGLTFLGPAARAGLEQGRLWTDSIVTTIPPALVSSGIATNNMSVALAGWAGGTLAGLGALYVVLLNGFLLGAVFAATFHYSLAGRLLEFVGAHGPLEITLILVCSAAGLGMGQALVAAEDRPRRVVLAQAARESLVLLLGCLPWFLVLGAVEGFLSPSPLVPAPLKAGLGASLLALFLAVAARPWSRLD